MLIPPNAIYWYDLEVYPNFFSACFERDCDDARWQFEISEWKHQGVELHYFLIAIAQSEGRCGGFNNIGFDYPILHMLMSLQGNIDTLTLKAKCEQIIKDGKAGDRWGHVIRDSNVYVKQLDLMKIWHFDNKAKLTSLKILEFNMGMEDIIELPYPPNKVLTYHESRHILTYNWHDIKATKKFGRLSADMIAFRDELTAKWNHDFTNANNGKVGCDIFIMELKKEDVNVSQKIQSPRDCVRTGEVLLPYLTFEHEGFKRIHQEFKNAVVPSSGDGIKEYFSANKEVFRTDLNGFTVQMGGGGIHASLSKRIIESDDEFVIVDSDVTSFYPRLGITAGFYPEHLGPTFCKVYQYLFEQRVSHKKGTMENASLKEALNIPYGKSNDIYSGFYDPKYTLSITINGQLLLCMLAEQLAKVPNLEMIQFNTDGLTYKVPRKYVDHCLAVSEWWEEVTGLNLEHANYSKMVIRDVNCYMAQYENSDKIKRKGDYNSVGLEMHKDHSALVVAKCAEAVLMRGEDITTFIRNHTNTNDFLLRTKVPKSSHLLAGDEVTQNVTRYYVSTDGVSLTKVMPPTDKLLTKWSTVAHWRHRENGKHVNAKKAPSGKYDLVPAPADVPPDRTFSIQKGFVVEVCNSLKHCDFNNINYAYYIAEVKKLVDELTR